MYRRKALLALVAALSFAFAASLYAQQPAGDSIGKFVTVFGAKIYYIDRGAGPVVVLVHGLGDQASIWNQTIGPLAKDHRVIAIDQIGYGHSDKPLLDYRTDTFVDFLNGFLSALHIGSATFVGNSLGGWVITELAIEHPETVERLVLVDPGGFSSDPKKFPPRLLKALRLSTRDDYRYFARLTFYDGKFYPTEAFLDYAIGERVRRGDGYTISKSIESLLRNDDVLDNRLGAVSVPTLIIWGRGDRLVPLSVAQRFNREIKGSRLQVIEKCGHIPQVECPADLNAALLQFLPGNGALPSKQNPISITGRVMTARANGTFDVAAKPLPPYNAAPDAQLGRFSLDKQYAGDLDGTGKGEMLTVGNATTGSAGYVAVERVTGTLRGKKGSFSLQHSGTMANGAQSLTITVAPGSGTGELTGISGTLNIIIESGKHSYVFDYSLPIAN